MSARSTDTAKQSAYFRLIKLPTMKSSADLSSPRIAWDHFADPESGLTAQNQRQLRILLFLDHPDDQNNELWFLFGAKLALGVRKMSPNKKLQMRIHVFVSNADDQ